MSAATVARELGLSPDGARALDEAIQERAGRVESCIADVHALRDTILGLLGESKAIGAARIVTDIRADLDTLLEARLAEFLETDQGKEDRTVGLLRMVTDRPSLDEAGVRALTDLALLARGRLASLLPGGRTVTRGTCTPRLERAWPSWTHSARHLNPTVPKALCAACLSRFVALSKNCRTGSSAAWARRRWIRYA